MELPQSVSQLILWLARSSRSLSNVFVTIYMCDNYLDNPSVSVPVAPLFRVMAFLHGSVSKMRWIEAITCFSTGNGSLFLVKKAGVIVIVKWLSFF